MASDWVDSEINVSNMGGFALGAVYSVSVGKITPAIKEASTERFKPAQGKCFGNVFEIVPRIYAVVFFTTWVSKPADSFLSVLFRL